MIKKLIEKLRPEPRKVLLELPPMILWDSFGEVIGLKVGDEYVAFCQAVVEDDDLAQDIVDGYDELGYDIGDDGLIYLND